VEAFEAGCEKTVDVFVASMAECVNTAGLLLYRVQRSVEFLLFNDTFSQKRHWIPPKGRVIGIEDDVKYDNYQRRTTPAFWH
jgi:hypothetical protein